MVEAIGGKAGSVVAQATKPAASTPVAAASARDRAGPAEVMATDTAATTSAELTRSMASSPPVDMDRVAQIRRAIAEGRFPISPATIADQFIALRLSWTSSDKA